MTFEDDNEISRKLMKAHRYLHEKLNSQEQESQVLWNYMIEEQHFSIEVFLHNDFVKDPSEFEENMTAPKVFYYEKLEVLGYLILNRNKHHRIWWRNFKVIPTLKGMWFMFRLRKFIKECT